MNKGFFVFIFTVGYMADKINNYFGDGSNRNFIIEYFVDNETLCNAGSLFFLDIKENL